MMAHTLLSEVSVDTAVAMLFEQNLIYRELRRVNMNLASTILLRDSNVVIRVEQKMGFPPTGELDHLRRCFSRRYGSDYEGQYFCADIRIRIALNNGNIPSSDLLRLAHPYVMGTRKNFNAAVKGDNIATLNFVTKQYTVERNGVTGLMSDFMTRCVRRQNYDLLTTMGFVFGRDYVSEGIPEKHPLDMVRYLDLDQEDREELVAELRATLPPLLTRELGRNRSRSRFMTLFQKWGLTVSDDIGLGAALRFNRTDLWPVCKLMLQKVDSARDRTHLLSRVAQSCNLDLICRTMKTMNVTHIDYFILKSMLRLAVRSGDLLSTRYLLTKIRNIHRRWMRRQPPSPKAEMEVGRYRPFLLGLVEEAAEKGHVFIVKYLMQRGRLAPTLALGEAAIYGGCIDVATVILPKINMGHFNANIQQRHDLLDLFAVSS